MANEMGWVVMAHTWKGMSTSDYPAIALALVQDPSAFAIVPERSMQGLFEAMAALRLTRGAFADDDLVKFPDAAGLPQSVIDPERAGYYGNSQGGVLGGAYLAMTPDLDRGVFGVPGMPYSLLLTRSKDFEQYFQILEQKYTDHRDIQLLIGLYEMLWEPAEGLGWAYSMNRDRQATIEPKQVLLQVAIGDAQVTPLGAHVMARAYGASTVYPQTRPIFGTIEQTVPFDGSAIVEFQYTDVPEVPVENLPPDEANDTHECPRRESRGQLQIRDFLENGVVEQYCDGICEGVRADTCP